MFNPPFNDLRALNIRTFIYFLVLPSFWIYLPSYP